MRFVRLRRNHEETMTEKPLKETLYVYGPFRAALWERNP